MTWYNKIWNSLLNVILVSPLYIFIPYITLYEHFCLHFLHCMWLKCIMSFTKDPSHRFLTNRWLAHNRFVGLGKPLEVVVHHLLIWRMVDLYNQDRNGFPMVSALVCMVTHWIGPKMSHDLRLLSSNDLTKVLHYVVSQPQRVLSLC